MDACNINLPITLSPDAETIVSGQSLRIPETRTKTIAAAEVIGRNTDLLLQILLLLPLKSVARFQSVSTQWRSLISSPYFSTLRIQNPNTTLPAALLLQSTSICCTQRPYLPSLPKPYLSFVPLDPMITNPPPPLTSLSFVNPNIDSHIYICNSCNSLLICCDPTRENYFVVNPTTKMSKKLPPPLNTSLVKGMSLAYDPYSVSYKVVSVGIAYDSNDYQIEVYSSESQTWKPSRTINYRQDGRRSVRFDFGIFLKGAIHWVSYDGHSPSCYFDIDTQSIKPIPMPQLQWHIWNVRYFGKWRDHLYLIYVKQLSKTSQLNVYEMKRDYSGWIFKFDVKLDESISEHFSIPFMYWEDDDDQGEKEKPILVMHVPNKIIRFKVKEDRIEKIFDVPSISLADDHDKVGFRRYGWFDVFPYYESLASV